MAEFEWPEEVTQKIARGLLLPEGTIVTLYAPIGDEPSTYPEHKYVVLSSEKVDVFEQRVKMKRWGE